MTSPLSVASLRARMREWTADAHRCTLRRRVGASFAALAFMLAVLIIAIVLSLVDFVDQGDAVVSRWSPASLRSQDALSDLINQETGVRGYALTGRPESLQPYLEYSAQEPIDIAAVRTYLGNSAVLVQELDAFKAAADTWRAQTALPLIALVQQGDPQAATRVNSLADKARFDVIRQRAAALSAGVQAALTRASNGRRGALVGLVFALATAAVLVSGVAFAVWRGLHRWVLGPVDSLAIQARRVSAAQGSGRIVPRGPPEFVGLGRDVESMRRATVAALADVEATSADLARSNADLEQFAYVASHDLSEPLRKIANFCQLLERQYGPALDDTGRQYIGFAVDGAKRMQALIADLLALSRVGRSTDAFVPVDTAAALEHALSNLNDAIDAVGAGVGHSDLPTVRGDAALLASLFENLVGNAIKYHGAEPPLVVVTAVPDPETGIWTFTVADNGIGIDPQYADRIFAIFQRLHLREAYPGTGIGLALCRKIVEFHGGRIWLDTHAAGSGATFRFTLPERPTGER